MPQTERRITNKKMKTTNKKIAIGIVAIMMVVFTLSFVLANQCNDGFDNDLDGTIDYPNDTGCSKATDNSESIVFYYAHGCLGKGERLMNVFGGTTYQCGGDICYVCVSVGEAGNYTTNPNKCNKLPQCGFGNGSGGGVGGNTTIDQEPPEFNITSIHDGDIFPDRRVLLEFSLDERSDVYYDDLDEAGERWVRVCRDCPIGNPSYSKEKSFSEGKNNLTFRAADILDNKAYYNVSFTVDSREPRIRSTEPRREEYSSGFFAVEFDEDNPKSLKLKINYSGGMDEYDFNLSNCTDERRMRCEMQLDQSDIDKYNEKEIQFWFELEDIAGSKDFTDMESIKVDSIFPVIDDIDYYVERGYYNFIVNFTETFPYSVEYDDLSDGRINPRRLCRDFDSTGCEGRVRLRDGNHTIQFIVTDEAGNSVGESRIVFIDTTNPRIYRTDPMRGFTNGTFEVQFKEDNPKNLTLHYLGNITEAIMNNCSEERGKTLCIVNFDFSGLEGQEVEYYFELEDVSGNMDVSRTNRVTVDTTKPVINNNDSFFTNDSRYIYFNINITEDNFEEVVLLYDYKGRTKERRLCSRLRDGVCEKRFSYRDVYTDFQINVIDEAGNFVSVPVELA